MIHNMITHVSDKLEVFRIEGNSPVYMGVSLEVLKRLNSELSAARNTEVDVRRDSFQGIPVIPMSGSLMPVDGVYIHAKNEAEELEEEKRHPFYGRTDW